MTPARRGNLGALVALATLASCRGILGIDGDRPLAKDETDASDAAPTEELPPPDAAPAPTFCDGVKPAADFCEDFDRSSDPKLRWDNHNRTPDEAEQGGGTIVLDTTWRQSRPNAVSLRIPAQVGVGATASAYLRKTFRDRKELSLKADVRIETEEFPPESKGVAPLVSLEYSDDPSVNLLVTLVRTRDGTSLATIDHGVATLVPLSQPIPVGVWKTVSLTTRRRVAPDGGSAWVAIARVEEVDAAMIPLAEASLTSTFQRVTLGPVAIGPLGDFRMTVDDVIVYFRGDL